MKSAVQTGAGLVSACCGFVSALLVVLFAVAPQSVAASQVTVGVYQSPTSQAYYQSVSGRYEPLLQPWREVISQAGNLARELKSEQDLLGFKGGVLVVPSAVALSKGERDALKRFRDGGGSLLVTWALGARDGEGAWAGYAFVDELLGVKVEAEVSKSSEERFLIPFGQSPVNTSLPPGQRLWMPDTTERPLMLRGGQTAAAYMRWERMMSGRKPPAAAIAYDELAGTGKAGVPGARWVMFGFTEAQWGSHPVQMRQFARDALAWLARAGQPQLANWPDGRRAAQIIEMDTEDGFSNAIHFAELMEEVGAKATFYCLTSEARKHPDLMSRLAKNHEIGFHGEVHIGFKGLPLEIQRKRLARMLAEMKSVTGADANGWPLGVGRGFRAPTEGYDDATEVALLELGLDHHVADPNRSDIRLPMLVTPPGATGSNQLVVLPRGQLDDLNYARLGLNAEQVGEALIGEYDLNLAMGGLGLVSVHSQNFNSTDKLLVRPTQSTLMSPATETLLKHVAKQKDRTWLDSSAAISAWWRARSRVKFSQKARANGWEMSFEVAPGSAVTGLTVVVPNAREAARADARWQGGGKAKLEWRRHERFSSSLVLGALEPGKHTLTVSFP